jgi:hypothetical protein
MPSSPFSTETAQQTELRYIPERSDRPTGVTVFAILNVLFGLTGILGVILSWAILMLGDRINLGPNPVMDALRDNEAFRLYNLVMGAIGLGFSVALLASGFGLLKMRSWARTVALVYAVYTIFATVIGAFANYQFIYRPVMERAAGQQNAEQLAIISGMIGGFAGACVALILPFAILIYFLRPSVKQAFQASELAG